MLNDQDKQTLLAVAQESIQNGLRNGNPASITSSDYSAELQETRATFVTLTINGELRGCIGTLNAYQALVKDVAEHAYAAAFQDPRFTALTQNEFPHLHYHISILSPTEPVEFESEQDLLEKIRPGIDGLVMEEGQHRGTFLPSVWESLPDRHSFLQHLKNKAGLPKNYWSETIRIQRYTVEDIESST